MKLKIAMVTPFPRSRGMITGGVEGVACCLIEALRQIAEIDVHVISPCGEGPSSVESRDGMTIHWLSHTNVPRVLAYWSSYRRTVHRLLERIGPDLTHFQCTAGLTIGYRLPYVLTIHGINENDVLYTDAPFVGLRRRIISFIERWGRERTGHTILISPYVMQEIGTQISGRSWEIENPVSDDFFRVRRENDAPVVLFVGRICKRKNVDGLLRSFLLVRSQVPGAQLRLAGMPESQEYAAHCTRFLEEHGLDNSVQFLGNVNRPTLLSELGKASCLALLSFQETAPLIVEEAMAAGVPVVASRLCGLPYLVHEGETGFLVDSRDELAVADRLVRLLVDTRCNREMGTRGREVALERFHALRVAERTLQVYRSLTEVAGV